ncbi:4-hydroxy-tetrahydrodipicolinate synthase [[Clostridium] cellulosi]|jgi:dihydrodipicolinate synthase (EC 4.2.1.52)|uniref:4-hydroxy-tetrahydrodipicolinate synthase n=1 Tax=[Clostridium] cellulosi TaxID=29343 RepID=A0A078KNT4_9FIRM|nr:MAG: 4-hydroxy-tetrahydrodipicolinate synthase [[Clostridium] cellulosi]CDZ24202.1 4-hydroxy-tetrahydrodipicolinate synthase [[Clostridium] cellulosi]
MKKTIFTGAAVAIVTPMNDDFSVNYEKLGELIDFQINNGTDAIVICGTTGESATLTHEEHTKAIDYTVKKVAGRVPVIAGTGSNDTRYAVELSLEAQKSGADALLLVTPYYNKTTQAGLVRHFTYIADRVNLPMIVYNVPSRTGLDIKPETYYELSKHPNIVAAKEANGNITSVAKTASLCGDNLDIYSGSDELIVPILSLGGKGVISVLSNIMPRETHEICAKFFSGDVEGSKKLQLDCMSLIEALFCETNPIPVKEALNLMGFGVGNCRMPLCRMQEKNIAVLKEELKKHNLIS